MPEIVKATVDKAKEGSLNHTRWLWAKAEEAEQRRRAENKQVKESLAALLMEQLEQQRR